MSSIPRCDLSLGSLSLEGFELVNGSETGEANILDHLDIVTGVDAISKSLGRDENELSPDRTPSSTDLTAC